MSIFRKLFSNKENGEMTEEEFFNTNYVKGLINKYKKATTLLRPHRSKDAISTHESKFGGQPNFAGFESYPCCDRCKMPLNFVLQLYKKDFPAFYFQGDANLFQLFRCPNQDCPDAYSREYDHKMFHFFFNADPSDNKTFIKPEFSLTNAESEVPDCYLKPTVADDFPTYDDFEGNDFVLLDKKFSEDLSESFMEKYTAIQNSKFGGYPSFTQSPYYPICSCGKTKDFFFQLSSEDIEDGVTFPPSPDKWSAHGIMIGDVGNMYYYACKTCGPQTIESYWDCC